MSLPDQLVNSSNGVGTDGVVAAVPTGMGFMGHIEQDGKPHFRSPWHLDGNDTAIEDTDKPIMVYLPGIDGTGLAAWQQFPALVQTFALVSLNVPIKDRTSFPGLVQLCVEYLRDLAGRIEVDRPIVVLGESFGGLLAVAVAAQCRECIDRMVLVNPATSYLDSYWPTLKPALQNLPPNLYGALPYAVAPVVGNPVLMALGRVTGGAAEQGSVPGRLEALRAALVGLLPMLGKLAEVLPQETLLYKLELLQSGCEYMDRRYGQVATRTLLIAAEQDLMLPSKEEATALETLLPNAQVRKLPYRAHAVLQEAGVNLVSILSEEGYLVRKRRMTGSAKASRGKRRASEFGKPEPLELPTPREFEIAQKSMDDNLRRFYSPVFYSTAADGTVARGLGHAHIEPGKPVILVGNHQVAPLDVGPVVAEVFKTKGVLPRGLTHPQPLAGSVANTHDSSGTPPRVGPGKGRARWRAEQRRQPWQRRGSSESSASASQSGGEHARDGSAGAQEGGADTGFSNFLVRWGAVPVGPTALFKLLRNGECVLLYPGGASEALKGTQSNERYELYWPSRPEFVRAAARFGATIIPVAGVGCEENAASIMDADSLERVGAVFSGRSNPGDGAGGAITQRAARRGVNANEDDNLLPTDDLRPKFYAPSRNLPLNRYYFLFGKPVETTKEMSKDREQAGEVYQEVKKSLEDGITYLLEQRERDPYRNPLRRLLWEQQQRRQAPSFQP